MSSIARAFTLRSRRTKSNDSTTDSTTTPPVPSTKMTSPYQSSASRSGTYQGPGKQVNRSLISAPTFITTTNQYALQAPDISTIKGMRKASSSISSGSSGDDSDVSSVRTGSRDTQLTDASSVDNSPNGSPNLRESNSSFAKNGAKTRSSALTGRSRSSYDLRSRVVSTADSSPEVPQIPMRAPSHSKRAHEQLHKKRSLQQFSSYIAPPAASSNALTPIISNQSQYTIQPATTASTPKQHPTREQRVSVDIFNPTGAVTTDATSHPFGPELAQLDAIASDFSNLHRDADLSTIRDRNLARFCADDYILEIQPLFQRCFAAPLIQVDPVGGWI